METDLAPDKQKDTHASDHHLLARIPSAPSGQRRDSDPDTKRFAQTTAGSAELPNGPPGQAPRYLEIHMRLSEQCLYRHLASADQA
jgi:hypothetical protein